jgi:hypothetical protein
MLREVNVNAKKLFITVMPEQEQKKSITLRQNWRHYFVWYMLAFIILPAAGAGIVLFYNLRKKLKAHKYIITDDDITAEDGKYEHHVDLVDIDHIELKQNWAHHLLGVGTLLVFTSGSDDIQIAGILHPDKYRRILRHAILDQKYRAKAQPAKPQQNGEPYKPGSMEKIDYLTGLWQQGLLSDEDYQKERKYLE